MKNSIKYITFYDTLENSHENRYMALSAKNKIDCILDNLTELNYEVEIISMSSTQGLINCASKSIKIKESIELKLFQSFGRKNKLFKISDYIFIRLQFFMYCLRIINKKDIVIVYHSVSYLKIILFLRKIKKFKLILEVEELYGDVYEKPKVKKMELKLAQYANAFIFPTRLLEKTVNKHAVPSIIIHGTYHIEKEYKKSFLSNKIHIVYAGTLDPRKGALTAIRVAKHLNENYRLHIIGFGTNEEQSILIKEIDKTNFEKGCEVSFDGVKKGIEYYSFLQSCEIGLCTQNSESKFNETSFPSKVLSYLSNGLRVVSVRIESLETSSVNNLLYYYDKSSPVDIANVIKSINLKESYDSKRYIDELNKKFKEELNVLIEEMVE